MISNATVLLPFHRVDNFLFDALASVFTSTNHEVRMVLIGPGSLDEDTRGLILNFCEGFNSEIALVGATTRNIAEALNIGLKLVKTEFTIRFDSDDLMMRGRIEEQVDYLNKNSDVIVVGGQVILISKSGRHILWPRVKYPTPKEVLREKMKEGCFLAHPAVAMRTDVILSLGGYREWFDSAEDYDLWLRVLDIGEIANLNRKVIKYRQHNGQASRKIGDVNKFTLMNIKPDLEI
jgi:hypothetical protein